jgi:hypothetical protein
MKGSAGKDSIEGNKAPCNQINVACSGFDEDQIEFIVSNSLHQRSHSFRLSIQIYCSPFRLITLHKQKSRLATLQGKYDEIGTTTKDLTKYSEEITHIIVRDNQDTHTVKIFAAKNCAVPIVKLSWLEDSYIEGKILPYEDYVPSFVEEPLKNATHVRSRGGILAGFSAFATSGVAGRGTGQLSKAELNLLCKTAGLKLLTTQASVLSQPDASKALIITSSAYEEIKAQKLVNANANGSPFVPLPNLLNVFRYQDLNALHFVGWKPEQKAKTPARTPLGASRPNEVDEVMVGFRGGDKYANRTKSLKSPSHQGFEVSTPVPNQAVLNLESVLKKQGFTHGLRLETVLEGGTSPISSEPKVEQKSDSFKTPAKKAEPKTGGTPDAAQKSDDDDSLTTPHAVPYTNNFVRCFDISLERSPERTTSYGKYDRKELGEDGTLTIFVCTLTGDTQVKYIDTDGVTMFDAVLELDYLGDVYGTVKGNAAFENVFWWDALNKSHAAGGTTIKGAKNPKEAIGLRRYFFWFENVGDLVTTLFHLFGNNIELVREFLKKDGKMTRTKKSLPCHAVQATEDDMDTDESEDEFAFPPIAVLAIEDDEGYYPGAESQAF